MFIDLIDLSSTSLQRSEMYSPDVIIPQYIALRWNPKTEVGRKFFRHLASPELELDTKATGK